jgi:catechol 2,3-dioxygenase-like lactoylglutathione lyase family enzyme
VNHSLVHIALRVPDLAASVEHAQAVLGVETVNREPDVVRLGLPGGRPCLILIADDHAALDHIALLTSEANLTEVGDRARYRGLQLHDTRELDAGEIRLHAPNGLAIELAAGAPSARNASARALGPLIGSLDHVSLNARELDATVSFFVDVLGFQLVDSVEDKRHWLRCGPNHHTVAVFEGEDTLHHYAFETADIGELQRLGDLLATRQENFVWGPGRHNLGANLFTYQLDPAGALLEVCSDMIQVQDEDAWEAQVWPAAGLTSAVMWGPPPPANFRELAIPIHRHEGIES